MLFAQIKSKRMEAMKARDVASKKLLTTLVGELEGLAKRENVEVDDELVIATCKKFISNNNDVINALKDSSPIECVVYHNENVLLNSFMPQQLSRDELTSIIVELGEKNIGVVMKTLNATYPGQFDRGMAAQLVKTL